MTPTILIPHKQPRKKIHLIYNPQPSKEEQQRYEALWTALCRSSKKRLERLEEAKAKRY